jgi:hypothetical protein
VLMAESKKSYPMLPVGSWWELRKKFKQSIPGVVTDSYLATVLNMQLGSARGNVLPYLKQLGIIDGEGKTGERAKLWRDDGHYAGVCKAMLEEVYPPELLHAVSDPNSNRDQAERWFANATGTGEVAARRMASVYAVLVEADASKQPDKERKDKKDRPTPIPSEERPKRYTGPAAGARPVEHSRPAQEELRANNSRDSHGSQPPGININLQVHISADATPDQIDQIFASMAKHIYPRG